MSTFFDGYDGLLCDLDGVVYAGAEPIQHAVETLNELISEDIPVAFITNNASRTAQEVAHRLILLGINTTVEHVMTSAQAVVELVKGKYAPEAGPVFVAGSPQLGAQIESAGFEITDKADDKPQVVVQGFNPKLGWNDLAQASFAIQNGAGWIASNLDLTIPLSQGVAPGNGSMVNAVSQATGLRPEAAAGKPSPVMFDTMAQKHAMKKPLVVGDRLDTDVLGAQNTKIDAALVETGIHRREDISEFATVATPTWIIPHLAVLLEQPKESHRMVHD